MGTGLDIRKDVSDEETPTWCLENERDELKKVVFLGNKLNEVDSRRLIELDTILAAKAQLKS